MKGEGKEKEEGGRRGRVGEGKSEREKAGGRERGEEEQEKRKEEGNRKGQGAPPSHPGTQSMASKGIESFLLETCVYLIKNLSL